MKEILFKSSVLLFVFFFGLLGNAQPKKERSLTIALAQEFRSLHPVLRDTVVDGYVVGFAHRAAVLRDLRGQMMAALVEEVPSMENGLAKVIEVGRRDRKKQPKIWSLWKIRASAKWGDGQPITCKDMAFTVKVKKSPKVTVSATDSVHEIESVTAQKTNPRHCVVIFRRLNPDFYRAIRWIVPEHLEGPIFAKHGEQEAGYERNSLYTTQPENPGLYSGPYLVGEVKPGSHIQLVANPHFYGPKPQIQKILLKVIANSSALKAHLLSGQVDMISRIGLDLASALQFEKKVEREQLPYIVRTKAGMLFEQIDFNLEKPILQDRRVRRALVHATNREKLTQVFFQRRQAPAYHNISPLDPWYPQSEEGLTQYDYSLSKARALLKEAGWVKAKDGFRYRQLKDKKEKLSLQITTTSGRRVRRLVQEYLQAEWKKIGVELFIKNVPARVFGRTLGRGEFDLALYAWFLEPESFLSMHSKDIPRKDNEYLGQNTPRWNHPPVDRLLEESQKEMKAERRRQIAVEVLKHYTAEVPVLPMYFRSDVAVIPKDLQGYALTGMGWAPSNFAENWYFQEKKNGND